MSINSFIYRKIIFPLVFAINKLDVKSKIEVLAEMDRSLFSSVSEVQNSKYSELFNAALNYSSYYGNIFKNIPSLNASISCLKLIPFLSKKSLRSKFAEIKSNQCCSYSTRMTAGTTGTPVTVLVDKNAMSWQLATRYYMFGWHGISLGDKEARFWGRSDNNKSYILKDFLLNRKRFSFCSNSQEDLLSEYKTLLNYRPDYFYGYSSLILSAALVCKSNDLDVPKLKAVICTAELLGLQQRKIIEEVFQCPVVVEYGCTESDIIAFECEYGTLHVMSHNILIDETTGCGGFVYTDLNNTAMPLIRYELGDNVKVRQERICECKRNLPEISFLEGRTINQLLTLPDGSTIHAVKFAYLIEEIVNMGFDVIQFKIVYDKSKLVFYINISKNIGLFEQKMQCGIDKILNGRLPYQFVYGSIKPQMNKKFSYFEQDT